MVDTRETFAHAVYRDKELTTEQRVEWLWKCCQHDEAQIERYERAVEVLTTYPVDPDDPCAERLRAFHAALVTSFKAAIQPPRERMDLPERRAPAALASILAERERQDAKWGVQDHAPHLWAAILAEECGEFAREAIQDALLVGDGAPPDPEAVAAARAEAMQAAAVALAIVECLDRDRWWRRLPLAAAAADAAHAAMVEAGRSMMVGVDKGATVANRLYSDDELRALDAGRTTTNPTAPALALTDAGIDDLAALRAARPEGTRRLEAERDDERRQRLLYEEDIRGYVADIDRLTAERDALRAELAAGEEGRLTAELAAAVAAGERLRAALVEETARRLWAEGEMDALDVRIARVPNRWEWLGAILWDVWRDRARAELAERARTATGAGDGD